MFKYALIAGLLMTQVPFVQTAEAFSVSDIKKLAKAGKQKFCRQGSFLKGEITVRSLGGAFCLHPGVGAIAEKICKGVDGFDDSGCAKNAKKVLAGKDVNKVIAEETAKDPAIADVAKSVDVEAAPAAA